MTVARTILSELRARGAVAYRRGDEVRMRPARAITPELLELVKRHKVELLPMLPDAPPAPVPLAASVVHDRPLEPGHCPDCNDRLPSDRVVALCTSCRLARNPNASTFPPTIEPCSACGSVERWRATGRHGASWICTTCHPPLRGLDVDRACGVDAPRYALAVQVDAIEPVAGPLALNPWTRVVHVERAVAADLASLRQAVWSYCRLWDDGSQLAAATALAERIDELLERLAACGARVRVVPVS